MQFVRLSQVHIHVTLTGRYIRVSPFVPFEVMLDDFEQASELTPPSAPLLLRWIGRPRHDHRERNKKRGFCFSSPRPQRRVASLIPEP
jgi:hypothetical protein